MKFVNLDIEKRVVVQLDKSIKDNTSSGIMTYGKDNDYPQIIEKLIYGSQTAKAASQVYASFIAGSGFENPEIGKIVVGKDIRGKDITLDIVRTKIAESLAKFHGVYIHCNQNLNNEVGNTTVLAFKDYRFSRVDDTGYCSKIAYHKNWSKEKELGTFKKNEISFFNTFNINAIQSNAAAAGGMENYKGQIYFYFIDDTYIYPTSPFDSVYLDMDTEYQIQLFKNREIRNGFTDKVIINISTSKEETEREEKIKEIRGMQGADGSKTIVFESEFDENGNLLKDGSFKIDTIKTNINDKLFENWEQSIPNNIRKAARNMPAVLIDFQMNGLSTMSGESIIQAANIYNAYTRTVRESVSTIIKDIYSYHTNLILKNNTNWKIADLKIIDEEIKESPIDANKEAQAVLRGSVGGVTSLLALQTSVSQGITDVESAIAIIEEIYGIPRVTAEKMLGTPKTLKTTENDTNIQPTTTAKASSN